MEYGPEIKRGSDAWPETDERPVWLNDPKCRVMSLHADGYEDTNTLHHLAGMDGTADWFKLGSHSDGADDIIAIRLPADHFAYKAIEAGFTPCNGKPDDWDGGVIFTCYPGCDGREIVPPIRDEMWSANDPYYAPVRGYHRKSTKQTVTIEKRSEDEWIEWAGNIGCRITVLSMIRELGLVIAPPTPLERFMAEHPDADRRTAELALSWSE